MENKNCSACCAKGWDAHRIHDLGQKLRKFTVSVTRIETVRAVDDLDDDRIVESAIAGGSAHIVTRDKALLRLREYHGILMVNDGDYLGLRLKR